ncbi:MAG: bifunctional 4-hydroxy-2-oxoglutarate aldolase/2-dehydro-3-deoxy-phosphogluconate aldolase [Pyrinomonadaceae bacterium]
MKKNEIIEKIGETKIIPVIRTDSADKARIIVEALIDGGIDVLEVTMTIPGAVELIARLSDEYKNSAVVIGAGTVLDAETARNCIEAGAKFVVSPFLNVEIISFCNRNEIAAMPGALTPTEIFTARQVGADMVKVFPVSAMGGASYIKAVKTVFPQINIVPTGGISLDSAVDYIKAGASAVGIGGELTGVEESIITKQARNLLDRIKSN